jgi:hypothetical protein
MDLGLDLSLNLDLNLTLSSEEDLGLGAVELDTGGDPEVDEELPLLTAPRTSDAELQRTMDAVAQRLNGLAKAQASPLLSPVPPTTYTHRPTINRAAPRSAREDKENQSVGDEGWSYVSAGECQGGLGLALGAKNGTGMGNVVYLSDNTAAPRRKKEKERKIKCELIYHH